MTSWNWKRKTGNPQAEMMPEAHSICRFPNRMTLTQGAFMLLTRPNPKRNLSPRCARRLLGNSLRCRRMRPPRLFPVLPQRRAGTYVHHIHDRIPLPVKLSDLLVRDLQQQDRRMILPRVLRVHGCEIEPPARNRVEDAHQCPLRVAIANVKDLHGRSPQKLNCAIGRSGHLAIETLNS